MIYCVEDDNSIRDLMIYTLSASGFKVSKFVFEAGERSKNPQTLIEILEFMANNDICK